MSDSSDSSKPRPKAAAVPHYTVGEEIMNSVTHGVGCLLGIAGLVLLIVFAALRGGGPAHMAAAIVYGVSIILEYLASTLYHAIQPARAKRVFRIIDHSCIYLLIAGSYTPFCLITLANDGGAVLFFAVWAIAIIGIALECFMRERQPHWVSGLVYLLMGWLVVFKLPNLWHCSTPWHLPCSPSAACATPRACRSISPKTCAICTVFSTCGCSPAASSSSWR